MSETKWTKGPWLVVGEMWEGDGAAGVGVESEESLIFVSRWTDRGDPGECCDQDYHDANLIAAAPDLYEALLQAMASINQDDLETFRVCNAALAKARGE